MNATVDRSANISKLSTVLMETMNSIHQAVLYKEVNILYLKKIEYELFLFFQRLRETNANML